jgi:uncharacterized damage-inducible protein DinB
MLAYSDALSARWWDDLARVPPETLRKAVDFSFLTPLGILTHMANVENAWLDVVEGAQPRWARHSTKEWSVLAPVRAYAQEARRRTHALVDGLDDAGLQRACGPVEAANFAKPTLTVEEIVFTVCTHEHIHRGEVLAALWHQDVQPPVADYPAYATPLR